MSSPQPQNGNGRIVCLTNVYGQAYHDLRQEPIARCLGQKRPSLYRGLELATGRQIVLLSSPPRGGGRRRAKWLAPVQTRYYDYEQYFCANWDAPKIRVPLSWWFYAWHAARHIRSGDIVLFDNYELIYVLAAYLTRLRRRVSFIFDFEDGKHLIDKSIFRLLSSAAETMGRPLLRAAVLAHPSLGRRLPPSMPTELVPGFVVRPNPGGKAPPNGAVDMLYSGCWDLPRGVDMLLQALEFLPARGWHLHVSGEGPLAPEVKGAAENARWKGKLTVHGSLASDAYAKLLQRCHIGINAQRDSDPISGATFPSKVFTYLSNDMLVVSSRASEVPAICGAACCYYAGETPQALAQALTEPITSYQQVRNSLDLAGASARYSVEGTADRLKGMLQRAKLI